MKLLRRFIARFRRRPRETKQATKGKLLGIGMAPVNTKGMLR